jgi:hypothetical protein
VNFVEGEETVPVAAVIDERSLERRLYARHLGEIDVPAEQLTRRAFEVEFLYPAIPLDHDPSLLGVRGIDEHFRIGHCLFSLARRCGGSRLEPRTVERIASIARGRVLLVDCDDGMGDRAAFCTTPFPAVREHAETDERAVRTEVPLAQYGLMQAVVMACRL